MKTSEKVTPIAAAVTALSTLLCCLPPTLAVAAATGSVGLFVASYQPWFVGISLVLLAVGLLQLRSAQRRCGTRRSSSVIVMCVSAIVVLVVVLFPQVVASVLADMLP
jgi:hypothetical protein